MITKIEAQLASMGLPWSYADAMAKQMFGIERCAWVQKPQKLKALISALHNEQEKQHLLALVKESFAERNINIDDFAKEYKLPKAWQRKVAILKQVINAFPTQAMIENGAGL